MAVSLTLPTPGDAGTNGTWGATLNTALSTLAGVSGYDVFKIKTADGTGATSTVTVADDNQLVGMSLGVGTWIVKACYFCTGAAAADIKITWAFSGTVTTASRGTIGPSAGVTSVLTSATAGPRTATSNDTVVGISGQTIYGLDGTNVTAAMEMGALIVTVAGTLKVQMAQGTSTASAVLIKAGSFVQCTQVA